MFTIEARVPLATAPVSFRHGRSSGDDFEIPQRETVWKTQYCSAITPMNTKMYVGNLSFDTTETDLREVFGQHGQVNEIYLPTDRESGRPRGFAFVTMNNSEGMEASIKAMDGKEFLGRDLTVNEARPREEHANSGGGAARANYGGGGGGRRERRY